MEKEVQKFTDSANRQTKEIVSNCGMWGQKFVIAVIEVKKSNDEKSSCLPNDGSDTVLDLPLNDKHRVSLLSSNLSTMSKHSSCETCS